MQGTGGPLYFPVPWAEEPAISFLATPEAGRHILQALRFRILDWEDKTQQSLEWLRAVVDQVQRAGSLPLGTHLLMGNTARAKIENITRNLQEGRVVFFQGVAEKA